MFGLFGKSDPVRDATLGELVRKGGMWRGTIVLGAGKAVPLVLVGDKAAPDPTVLAAARALHANYTAWQPAMARALFDEHYVNGRDALADGPEEEAAAYPRIDRADDVWPHVTPVFVAVAPIGGELVTEIGCACTWDEEHTLGVRLRDGTVVEMNGSVLAP